MLKNLFIKFLAVFGALVFWIATVSLERAVKDLPDALPVQAFNLASDLAIKNALPSVRLKISSESQDVAKIPKNNFQAFVDLQGLKKGEHTVAVQVTSQNKDLAVVQVEPKNIAIVIESRVSREVPVQVLIKGDPADGYQVGNTSVDEKAAQILGISEAVATISQVNAVIQLEGNESEDFEKLVTLSVFDAEGNVMNNIRVEPEEMIVSIEIRQSDYVRIVGIRPVFHGQLPGANVWLSKINLNPATVLISGKRELIENIEYIETESIDREQIQNSLIKRVQLIFPQGVQPQKSTDITTLLELTVSPVDSENSADGLNSDS